MHKFVPLLSAILESLFERKAVVWIRLCETFPCIVRKKLEKSRISVFYRYVKWYNPILTLSNCHNRMTILAPPLPLRRYVIFARLLTWFELEVWLTITKTEVFSWISWKNFKWCNGKYLFLWILPNVMKVTRHCVKPNSL